MEQWHLTPLAPIPNTPALPRLVVGFGFFGLRRTRSARRCRSDFRGSSDSELELEVRSWLLDPGVAENEGESSGEDDGLVDRPAGNKRSAPLSVGTSSVKLTATVEPISPTAAIFRCFRNLAAATLSSAGPFGCSAASSSAVKSTVGTTPSRRRDCHFDDTPCVSLLIHLLKVEGGVHAAE